MRKIVLMVMLVLFASCSTFGVPIGSGGKIKHTINNYDQVKYNVKLGDSKNKVLAIMQPTQQYLSVDQKKPPETYYINKTKNKQSIIEIYYMRSGWSQDGLTTDDEFTPYVFENDKLIAIGWQALGGIKSQGQVVPVTNVKVNVDNSIY